MGTVIRRCAAVVGLVIAGACASGQSSGGVSSPAEMEALYRARTDSARTRFTPADVQFITAMISHHAQALNMARLATTHDAGPAVQTLAARIINGQQDEITLMRQWLKDRSLPDVQVILNAPEVRVIGAEHAEHMPGMLSPEQMAELAAARGRQFDRLFLTFMIQHHRGAVAMVQDLVNRDGALQDEAAFKLASDIQVDQITEVGRMERMLVTMSGVRRAPSEPRP
jgi:uncharacterized protein (DUF305 family)